MSEKVNVQRAMDEGREYVASSLLLRSRYRPARVLVVGVWLWGGLDLVNKRYVTVAVHVVLFIVKYFLQVVTCIGLREKRSPTYTIGSLR